METNDEWFSECCWVNQLSFGSQSNIKFNNNNQNYFIIQTEHNVINMQEDTLNIFINIIDTIWETRNNIVHDQNDIHVIEAIKSVRDNNCCFLSNKHNTKTKISNEKKDNKDHKQLTHKNIKNNTNEDDKKSYQGN